MQYTPVIGVEREFYANVSAVPEVLGVPLLAKIIPETGANQFEYILHHTADIPALIEADRAVMAQLVAAYSADFSAKPFAGSAGSGLHLHIHLENEQGENVFTKQGESLSEPLGFAIGGLLASMQGYMAVFAPTRARFEAPDKMTPTTISWGANNRTTALRLPDTGTQFRRIEHRVSGADAVLADVIDAVLKGISRGILERISPPPQIYGDARLPEYGCTPFISA
jgi:glutamine synthetase